MSLKSGESIMPCQGQLLCNERLADYTTWRVGGIAQRLYKPHDVSDLALFMQQLPAEEPIIWLGLGSNCLIRDGGFRGTVIVTQGCLKEMGLLEDGLVRVEAGVSCASMARFVARNSLAGGEFWAGIPGTMGGALRMNAGCCGGETWPLVVEIETLDRQGVRRIRTPAEFEVAYRHVKLLQPSSGLQQQITVQEPLIRHCVTPSPRIRGEGKMKGSYSEGPVDEWFVAGTFKFAKGDKEKSLHLIRELLDHRAKTQPTNEYNCGSVFKNPPDNFAARLIEGCGLKGKQIGGAVVSTKHANFIINQERTAKAQDIETLIELVRDRVRAKTSIDLVREIHILGEL